MLFQAIKKTEFLAKTPKIWNSQKGPPFGYFWQRLIFFLKIEILKNGFAGICLVLRGTKSRVLVILTVKNKTLPLQNSLCFSSITLHGRDKTLKSKYETDVGLYVLSDRIKSLHGRVFVLLSRVKTLCTSEEAFMIRAPSIRIGITDVKQTIPVDSKI